MFIVLQLQRLEARCRVVVISMLSRQTCEALAGDDPAILTIQRRWSDARRSWMDLHSRWAVNLYATCCSKGAPVWQKPGAGTPA